MNSLYWYKNTDMTVHLVSKLPCPSMVVLLGFEWYAVFIVLGIAHVILV